MISAKATTPETTTRAIIVSFAAEWHEAIVKNKIKAVIRKRIPQSIKPQWLYFHVNAPIGAIVGRAKIKECSFVPIAKAKSCLKNLGLAINDLDAYVAGEDKIGFYSFEKITPAKTPVSTEQFNHHVQYHPPQSFIIASKDALKILDKLAEFSR